MAQQTIEFFEGLSEKIHESFQAKIPPLPTPSAPLCLARPFFLQLQPDIGQHKTQSQQEKPIGYIGTRVQPRTFCAQR